MTIQEFARRMNSLTPEQIAQAMERLPTDALEWAVHFEAMAHQEPRSPTVNREDISERSRCCKNCEYWDGGGERAVALAVIGTAGDCLNWMSDRFTTEAEYSCRAFFPSTTRKPAANRGE